MEKVENANNGDLEVLDTFFKDYFKLVCRETFVKDNKGATNIPEWVKVTKGQMKDVLEARTECLWKELIEHKGRATRQGKGTAVFDLSFVAKPIVNDFNEVIEGVLRAGKEKERDKTAKKIIKTLAMPLI